MGGAIFPIADAILLGAGKPVVGVRFLVCGNMGWQIWIRVNKDISFF